MPTERELGFEAVTAAELRRNDVLEVLSVALVIFGANLLDLPERQPLERAS